MANLSNSATYKTPAKSHYLYLKSMGKILRFIKLFIIKIHTTVSPNINFIPYILATTRVFSLKRNSVVINENVGCSPHIASIMLLVVEINQCEQRKLN